MPLNGDNCYLSVEWKDLQEIVKWTGYDTRESSAPLLGLFSIICQHVYLYIQQISGERLQGHWSSGFLWSGISTKCITFDKIYYLISYI